MNTLEMINELRKNPKLKAICVVDDKLWKVKCVGGNIVWDNNSEYLCLSDYVLNQNKWSVFTEGQKYVKIYKRLHINLENGIGTIPNEIKVIGDLGVYTSDDKTHTIRPIGNKFAVPTESKEAEIYFETEVSGTVMNIYTVK